LTFKPVLNVEDKLVLIYYLLIIDRISSAIEIFLTIPNPDTIDIEGDKEKEEFPFRLQYDYLAAYLDFFNTSPSIAREIAEKYINYPIPRWRDLFKEIIDQLNEINKEAIEIDEENKNKKIEKLLDFEIENDTLKISYQILVSPELIIKFYIMDIELLFSSSPFVQKNLGQFSYVMPNIERSINISKSETKQIIDVDIPEECENTNVMVEVCARNDENMIKVKPHFSHNLSVNLHEEEGEVKVYAQDTGVPLPSTYIKVYAQYNGIAIFYKDGYTDLRGAFDFLSLNFNMTDYISKFSILVFNEKYGSTIVESSINNNVYKRTTQQGYGQKKRNHGKYKKITSKRNDDRK